MGKISLRKGSLMYVIVLLVLGCSKDNDKPKPSITDLTPSMGHVGETITINGSNFSETATLVNFNGVDASISSSTKVQIVATVPQGATTGKINVTVNGVTGVSATDFTVLAGQTITSFAPLSGAVGSQVTITGTDFAVNANDNIVKFNGTPATVINATSTSITVAVPAGATTGRISVGIFDNVATSSSDFTVPAVITSFSPSTGSAGTSVVIVGTNFNSTPLNNTVKFNGVEAIVTSVSATQLVVTAPFAATTGKISIAINGATTVSASDFSIALPTITDFTPAIGAAGIAVKINGTNFSPVASFNAVKFNGTNATVTSATPTSITATVPVGVTLGKISVQVGPTNSVTSSANFQPCSGAAELIISNLTITSISLTNNSLNYEFDLLNAGDTPADLTKAGTQAYQAPTAAGTNAQAAGGAQIGPYLAPSTLASGQSVHISYSSNIIGTGYTYATYPYLVVVITGTNVECNTANNTMIKAVQ